MTLARRDGEGRLDPASGVGEAPTWRATSLTLDRSSTRCVARVNGAGGGGTAAAYALIERVAGADALADALAALVSTADGAPPEAEFRAAFARLGLAQRAQVSAALRGAAMATDCDQSRAVLASELLDLAADVALTDALVAHLARFWQTWLPTSQASGWNTRDGEAFQPRLQRLAARLSQVRPGPVGNISCPVTQIRVNGAVDRVPEARAAVERAGVPCPATVQPEAPPAGDLVPADRLRRGR